MAAVDIKDASTWPSLANPDAEFEEVNWLHSNILKSFEQIADWRVSQVVKSIPGGTPDIGMFTDIPSLRKFMADMKPQGEKPPPPAGIKEEDRQIPMGDGHKITVRIHSPEKAPSGGSPLYVMYHGGGWCIGGLEEEEPLIRNLVSQYGMTVVNVDYRLGPEYKFPTAHDDCYDATKWVGGVERCS